MNEQDFIREAREAYIREDESTKELYQYLDEQVSEEDIPEDISHLFDDGYFSLVTWLNHDALEADSNEILLSTGGPATGIVMIQNHPYFWYQNWFTEKYTEPLRGDTAAFYYAVFEMLEEITA